MIEVKFDAATGIVAGYASTFGGAPDSYGDIVMPGAFAASLAAHKAAGTAPLMLWSHNAAEVPIGTWTTLREDANGLYVEGQLNLDVAKARDVHSALRARSTGSLSIGFRVPAGGRVPGAKSGTYLLKAADLIEVSLVNVPANIRARVTSAKATTSKFADRLAAAAAELKEKA